MAEEQTFLEKVIANSSLETTNDAQVATNIVFRILRDMLPTKVANKVGSELEKEEPLAEMKIKDLWLDTNPMVSFFSRISPVQQLNISRDIFMLRLSEEGALPRNADPETVAKAVFRATKDELPSTQIENVARCLSGEMRQLWEQA